MKGLDGNIFLVTGGAGFIGRWVVKSLLDKNYDVVVFDNLSNGRKINIIEFEGNSHFKEFVIADITNQENVNEIFLKYNFSTFIEMTSQFQKNNQTFITCLITPLMTEVGELWAQTEISTAEEHVISNRVEKIIIDKISRVGVSNGRGTIILAPVEGEQHVISLLSLELIFSELGYHTINIGRPLPIRSMIQYIKELKRRPQWLFMSITLRAYIGTLYRNLESIRNAFNDDIKIAIGGQGLIEKNRKEFPEADVIVINEQDLQKFIDFMS